MHGPLNVKFIFNILGLGSPPPLPVFCTIYDKKQSLKHNDAGNKCCSYYTNHCTYIKFTH